jgi:16S rRNA (cytosine1402-N4)-methyltransferase
MREVIEALAPADGKTVVDCTLGRAGHAREIGRRVGKSGKLIGLDVDPRNLEFARGVLLSEGSGVSCEVRVFQANFAELGDVLAEVGVQKVDGILADLGVSTNQLFEADYGMSFSADMPLDMRIDPRIGESAADIVNRWPEGRLADVLYNLAQERWSRRIARKIGEQRRVAPITTTGRLADVVRSAVGHSREKIDPATRTFLALRMAVNREMENLQTLLSEGPGFLRSGGRMAVISFQSMEDRLVKRAFAALEEVGEARVLTKKPVGPSEEEVERNARSRSSKMRAIEKL